MHSLLKSERKHYKQGDSLFNNKTRKLDANKYRSTLVNYNIRANASLHYKLFELYYKLSQ